MKDKIIVANCKYSLEFCSTKEEKVKDIPTRLMATGKLIPRFGSFPSVSFLLQYESCWSLPWNKLKLLSFLIFFYLNRFPLLLYFCLDKNLSYYLSAHSPFCVNIPLLYNIAYVARGKDALSNDCIAFYVKYMSIQLTIASLTEHKYEKCEENVWVSRLSL